MNQTAEILSRSEETVRNSANPAALRLLENGRKHQERAGQLVERQKYRLALAQTLVARRLADRAVAMAGNTLH
jgi:hypothetical protein